MTRTRILCISFSDITADARVLRQIDILREFGDVTTLAYGSAPAGVVSHLAIPDGLSSLPQTPMGVLNLAARRFRAVEFQAPAVKAALKLVAGHEFDVVVANEARALSLAYRIQGKPRVWCDLHEWAPEERTHVTSWRLLVAPFMDWLCQEYLPRVDAATTVNSSIARMYLDRYGVEPEIVRNARAYVSELAPVPLEPSTVRLVHSGGAVPGRNLEAIIDAVDLLGDGYTLDLFLVPSRQADSYWKQITNRIEQSSRTTLHDAVSPDELPTALNPFDLGVYLLPPHTPNHRLMLPNKFFDFVQARLGFVYGPSIETDRLIRENGLGIIAAGYAAEDLAEAIRGLSRDQIAAFKHATDSVAQQMSSDADISVERSILSRLALRG